MVTKNEEFIGIIASVAAVYVIVCVLVLPSTAALNITQIALALQLFLLFAVAIFSQPATPVHALDFFEMYTGPLVCLACQAVLGIAAPLCLQGMIELVITVSTMFLILAVLSSIGLQCNGKTL